MADGVASARAAGGMPDASGARANWRLDGSDVDVSLGWDYRDAWRLPDIPTAYLRIAGKARRRASARLLTAEGADWPIRPLRRYDLSLLAGVHRARAWVRLSVLDEAGDEQLVLIDPVAPLRGGRRRSDYHAARLSFVSPPDSHALRIEVGLEERNDADDQPDQFLFLAQPMLAEAPPTSEAPLWAVHEDRLFVAAPGSARSDLEFGVDKARFPLSSEAGGAFAEIALPLGALDGRRHCLSLWAGGEETWADWPVLPTPTDGGLWRARMEDIVRAETRLRRETPERPVNAPTQDKPAAAPFAPIGPLDGGDPRLPLIQWRIGAALNDGWAYGNNARRLADRLPSWRHRLTEDAPADLVVHFDALLAQAAPPNDAASILRVGGDRPLDACFGRDPEALRAGLAGFDAVITLSPALQRRVAAAHPNAVFIPNGLDLDVWRPEARRRDPGRPFTAGFAGGVKTEIERDQKGLNLAIAACETIDAPLIHALKGRDQIPHARMIEAFYSRIDVLVHPVAAGREGTSNVIMEALALGLPVILTPEAGFHGEALIDGQDALMVARDTGQIADALRRLRGDADVAAAIGRNARAFAETHHDIDRIAAAYEALFRPVVLDRRLERRPAVSVHPFWTPTDRFASSRLRGDLPGALLTREPRAMTVLSGGSETLGEVAVVIQSAQDGLMQALDSRPETVVVYDVCDRYFENDRIFETPSGPVSSQARFHDLAARADVLIAPSVHLKGELAGRLPDTPVYVVPEMRDYGWPDRPATSPGRCALWFGSPQRGNFDAATWMLDALRGDGFTLTLVSKAKALKARVDPADRLVDWSAEALRAALTEASLCIVAHAPEEFSKSANRLVTAVTAGVPTLVCDAPAAEALLHEAGCDFAIVRTPQALTEAARRLDDPAERRDYIGRVQAVIERRHGDHAVRQAYLDLVTRRLPARSTRQVRAAFVGGLDARDDADRALFDLVVGLKAKGAVAPAMFGFQTGDLSADYRAAGVRTVVLGERADAAPAAFRDALGDGGIEHVVAAGVASAPFILAAADAEIPAVLILRDPPSEPVDVAVREAMIRARTVVFSSEAAAAAWRHVPRTLDVRVIGDALPGHAEWLNDMHAVIAPLYRRAV